MEKKITSRITKGVIIAGSMILLDIILQATHQQEVPDGLRYMPRLAIVFVGIVASCYIYIRQSGGATGFGEVFSHGFRTTAVIAFLMAAYTFIAIKFIYPPPSAAEMESAIKAIEQQGNALHDEATKDAIQAAKNRWIIYVSISIFASVIPGLLGSLMGAGIAKKNR